MTNKNGTKLVEDIVKDIKTLLDSRMLALKVRAKVPRWNFEIHIKFYSQKIVKVTEELPRVFENTTNFENYTFVNTRRRDKFKKELETERAIRNAILEERSNWANHTKKRIPPEPLICYKSNKADDNSDEPDFGCYAKFNESINAKSKESSVFFPIDVFDKDANITRIIHRTRGLDKAFNHNYRNDPSIGWQYFCNSTGLFRHFPATTWDFYPINTYDCRTRHWYTGAASSSKDVIILIEGSGSMLGERILIAKDVVRNILDTLTPNDFVNILVFNETSNFTIGCMNGLVQSTASNILELKNSLSIIEPRGQTNLSGVLEKAFRVLSNHTVERADCNQVIMLITDGMEYNQTVQNVFRDWNWNRGNNVRVFSYLIGEQIPEHDYEQVKLMACENRGYYSQIDTISETREQALKYIPVMSRPLTYGDVNKNPIHWSNLYADMIEPRRTTNYDWDCRQKEVQRDRVVKYLEKYDWYPCITDNDPETWNPEYRKYVFMTTVSMPAFERVSGMNAVRLPSFSIINSRLDMNF